MVEYSCKTKRVRAEQINQFKKIAQIFREVFSMKKFRALFIIPLIVGILFCCSGCKKKENPWIPEVQGSHVREMPYEQINGDYSVEKYTDFKSFKKSELADYNFIKQRVAKEERYAEEFFKTRNLAVIKFNRPEKDIDYTVIAAPLDGNSCTVKLLPIKDPRRTEERETTYCCFLETEKDIKDWNISLEIESEVIHESHESGYIAKDNSPYLFEDETAPVIYKITSPEGASDFIEDDRCIDRYNIISVYLNIVCTDEFFEKSDLLLIRVPSYDMENCVAYIKDNVIEIVSVKSNHYMYGWEKEHNFSKLITLSVPKDLTPESAVRFSYTEYEDNADNRMIRDNYTVSGTTDITDNLTRFDLTEAA